MTTGHRPQIAIEAAQNAAWSAAFIEMAAERTADGAPDWPAIARLFTRRARFHRWDISAIGSFAKALRLEYSAAHEAERREQAEALKRQAQERRERES
jgi:hypothetical protein